MQGYMDFQTLLTNPDCQLMKDLDDFIVMKGEER